MSDGWDDDEPNDWEAHVDAASSSRPNNAPVFSVLMLHNQNDVSNDGWGHSSDESDEWNNDWQAGSEADRIVSRPELSVRLLPSRTDSLNDSVVSRMAIGRLRWSKARTSSRS